MPLSYSVILSNLPQLSCKGHFFAHKQPATSKSTINEHANPPNPNSNMEVDKPPMEMEMEGDKPPKETETNRDEHPKETEGGKPPEEAEGGKPHENAEGELGEPPKEKVYSGWRKKSLERRKKGMSYACNKEVIAALATAASGADTVIITTAHVDCKVVACKELCESIHEDHTLLVLEIAESRAKVKQTKRKVDHQAYHAEKWKDMAGTARIKCNMALKHAKAVEAALASLRATIMETIVCRESEMKAAWVEVQVKTVHPFVIEGCLDTFKRVQNQHPHCLWWYFLSW